MASSSIAARRFKPSSSRATGLSSTYYKDVDVKDESDSDSDPEVQLRMPEPGQAPQRLDGTSTTDAEGLPLPLQNGPQARLVLLASEEAKKLKKSLATTNPTATIHVIGVDRLTSLVIFSRDSSDWNAMANIALLRILYERRSPRLSFVDKARDVARSQQGTICLVGACFAAAALGAYIIFVLPPVMSEGSYSLFLVD
ncbi:hypothetical protein MD484_g6385, partial [Candolleomyces efflorescens]